MRHVDILKLFYERTEIMINDIIKINSFMLNNNDMVFKPTNMGNRNADITYRFAVADSGTSFNITNVTDFILQFGVYKTNSAFGTHFSTADDLTQIQLGLLNEDVFTVRSNGYSSDMHYPIQEEQYFQNLTMMDLSSEEVYDFFMGKRYEFACYLHLSAEHDTSLEVVENFLNSTNQIRDVLRTLRLLSSTYCQTNGLNI